MQLLPVEGEKQKSNFRMAANIPAAFKRLSDTMPTVYFSHGGGPMPLMGDEQHKPLIKWLSEFASTVSRRPKCILVISAHWEEAKATVLSGACPPLLFDYYGFPEETYAYKYPAPGHPALAASIKEKLETAGVACGANATRGFDHGMFVPLLLMYPKGDIPVVQLSLVKGLDPALHIKIGHALSGLREEGVLILGSGSSYHNTRGGKSARQDSEAFDTYLVDACTNSEYEQTKREQLLCDWKKAPAALACHPREEHLLPLMVMAGAGGSDPGQLSFNDYVMGAKMCSIRFD